MKKIITSLGMLVFVGAVIASGTGAFFSDTETSTGNVFTAGAIDLKVDSVGHVNGLVCFNGEWASETAIEWVPESGDVEGFLQVINGKDVTVENTAYNVANPANVPQAGDECVSTWALNDLVDGVHTFFNFVDIKPGDEGENTISLHVDNNDAWMCVDVDITKNDDVSSTEPELEAGDLLENLGNNFDGELAENLTFFAWADDGDNVWENGELPLFSNISGPASDVLGGKTYAIADSNTPNGPLAGATTHYIGLAWCAGTIVPTAPGNVTCNGATMGNDAQTDSLEASIAFRVEQARNNEDFTCAREVVEPVVTTLTLAKTVVPAEVVPDSAFTLTATGPTNISGIEGALTVTNAVVLPGVYTLAELPAGPGGETLTWSCSGNVTPEVGNQVTIALGETVTCEATNSYPQ